MSESTAATAASTTTSRRGGMLVWILISTVSAALGVAVPFVVSGDLGGILPSGGSSHDSGGHETAHSASAGHSSSGHSGEGHGGEEHHGATFGSPDAPLYVPFDQVVVNLDESRMTRYLRLAVTLQIARDQELEFNQLLAAKKLILKNWLLSHLSDKTLEDIRGAVGQNRLRREIRDHFNSVLYPEGYDHIYDVLFDEFNVQ